MMPLVISQAWLTEKLAGYRLAEPSSGRLTGTPDYTAGEIPERETRRYPGLNDLVSIICSRILTADPGLVAEVASGRTSRQTLHGLIARTAEQESMRAGFFQADLQQQVMDFLFGYGPLQSYVENENISDIDGTAPDEFTLKINGQRQVAPITFADSKAYDTFCRLVIIRNGGIINENDSHCRVTDEKYRLRINVTVPPRSVNGPTISIRKHRRQSYNLQDLENLGMLNAQLSGLLAKLAQSPATVLFCGKGAAGKTTLLRAFIQAMPPLERVLVAESDSELFPEKPCCLVQRIKKSNEGGRPVSLRDLIADGLTMSLDTYCIGEIVGEEALEFIRAAYSGHRCLATTHADCASDALDRLLTLARPGDQAGNDLLLRRMLGRSVRYIVCLRDFRVIQVLRNRNYLEKEDTYDLVEIWPAQQDPAADPAVGQLAVPLVSGS